MSQHVESSSIRSRIANHAKLRKFNQNRRTILAALAAFVVLGVAVALMQNGMAAQHEEVVLDCHYIGEVAHTHDKSCYNADGDLVCPLRERELHKHTDACYDEDGKLICGKDELTEEHVHGEGCFKTIIVPGPAPEDESDPAASDPADSTSASSDPTSSDTSSDSTSDAASDNAAANTPDGVAKPDATEPAKPEQTLTDSIKDADGKTLMSVEAKAPEGALPEGSTMTIVRVEGSDLDKKQLQNTVATESEGKIVDFQAVKVAIKDAKGTTVIPDKDLTLTITSSLLGEDRDAAKLIRLTPADDDAKTDAPTAELIDLFGEASLKARDLTLEANQVAFEASRFSTFVLATVSGDITMRATPDGARVRVDAPAAAGIPAGSTLQATEIAQDSDDYDTYRDEALKAASAKEAEVARFFDIKIIDPSGNEIQPAEPVRVRIKLDDAPAPDTTPEIVHFADDAASAERIDDVTVDKAIADFDAQSFSVYGVVYTVDFTYHVDGDSYETSVKGGEVINLKNLLLTLKVADKDDLNDFVAAIDKVEFSNPELVRVIKVDKDTTAGEIKAANDINPECSADLTDDDIAKMDARKFTAPNYALASLKPFDSDETLTVTMANGDVFTIAVADASSRQLRADNADKLTVHKFWRSTDDISDYPEVRFTLYQSAVQGDGTASGGTVYVDGSGRSYENIPLNTANNYTWECPVDLPSGYGYYVVEDTNSGDNGRCVNVYQNSQVDSDGFITTAGALIPIDNGKSSKEDFYIYDYYSSTNVNHQPRTDEEMAKGWDGGLASNKGTITIENRNKEYMQFDVKKKWLVYRNSGELWTATGEPSFQRNIVIKTVLLRRLSAVNTEESGPGVSGRTDLPWIDGESWERYGNDFYWGYNSTGGDGAGGWVVKSDNEFLPTMRGGWNLNVENSNQYLRGLPEYAFYRDSNTGELKRACCNYALLEVGMYNDVDETPLNPADHPEINFDYDYIYDIAPAVWSGAGGETEIFPKVVAQDQDRLINSVASDLILQKEWDGATPSDVSYVFVKVFRKPMSDAEGDNSNLEDVTNWIGARNDMSTIYGMAYVDDTSCIGWSGARSEQINPNGDIGGYLKLKSDGTPLTIKGMKLTRGDTADKLGVDNYQYWIQEIGYQKTTGEVVYDASTMNPCYSTWSGTSSTEGSWNDEKTTDPASAKVTIGKKGTNRLKVTNTPSTDLHARKQFYDAKGEPTRMAGGFGVNPLVKSVLFRVKQKVTEMNGSTVVSETERYLTFKEDGHNTPTEYLELTQTDAGTGYLTTVSPITSGSNAYKVENRDIGYRFRPDTLSPDDPGRFFRVDPYEHEVRGLEYNSSSGGTTYRFTYEIEEVGYVDRSYSGDAAYIDTTSDDAFHSIEDREWASWQTMEGGTTVLHNSRSNIIIAKKWVDAAGNTLDPNQPWDSSISEVKFSVRRVAQKSYYSLDTYKYEPVPGEDPVVSELPGLTNLSIKEANQIITVKPNDDWSDYTITSIGNATAEQSADMNVDNWGVRIYGLEGRTFTDETISDPITGTVSSVSIISTYEIVEEPIENCKTTYDPANTAGTAGTVAPGGTVTIKNQRESVKITVAKTFVGLDDVLDGLTTDDIRDDYDSLPADVKKLLEGITLKLINADSPLPAALNGNGVVFEMTLKQLVQLGVLEYDDATLTFSGTVTKETSIAGVNVAPLLPGSKFELSESGQDAAAAVPAGFHFKEQAGTANPTTGIPTADKGELSLAITNTYEPQVDIKLYKVDSADRDKPSPTATLKGAEFELWKYKETADPADAYGDGLDTTFGTGGKLTVTDGTPADGIFDLSALKPGHYELHETKVPDGHIMMAGTPRFEITYDTTQKKMVVVPGAYMHDTTVTSPDPDDVALVANVSGEWRIIFANPPGSELPHAGGVGTLLATIAGTAMVAAATLYLYGTRKRRKAEAHK